MRGGDVRKFQSLGFEAVYSVEVDPEFPSDGDWHCPVFSFDREGHVAGEFVSRWGAPLVVRVSQAGAPGWVGMFPAGGLGGVEGVFAGPAPAQMCVVADGQVYLARVDAPQDGAVIVHDQVAQVVPVADPPLVLLIRFMDIVAIGPAGIAWRSPRLAVDDLRVVRVDADGIHCTGELLGESPAALVVDTATGQVIAGPRLEGPGWH